MENKHKSSTILSSSSSKKDKNINLSKALRDNLQRRKRSFAAINNREINNREIDNQKKDKKCPSS